MEQLVAHRYQLGAALGRGSSATVYRATDRHTGAPVAVKLLHPTRAGDAAAACLRRETELLAGLNSPRFACVIDLDVHAGRAFLVTEFVDGVDLHGLVRRHGRLRVSQALHIGLDVARARTMLERHDATDADISLAELKLCDGQVKVVEFVLAPDSAPTRRLDSNDEQAAVQAIGAILYELLTGRPPLPPQPHTARSRSPSPWAPAAVADLPLAVREVLDRCLTPDRAARYRNPTAVVTALTRLLQPAWLRAFDLEPTAMESLTRREVEVLRLLAVGCSNREIATALVVSVRTAEHHVAAIYAKIGARRRAEAAAYALRHGLVFATD